MLLWSNADCIEVNGENTQLLSTNIKSEQLFRQQARSQQIRDLLSMRFCGETFTIKAPVRRFQVSTTDVSRKISSYKDFLSDDLHWHTSHVLIQTVAAVCCTFISLCPCRWLWSAPPHEQPRPLRTDSRCADDPSSPAVRNKTNWSVILLTDFSLQIVCIHTFMCW